MIRQFDQIFLQVDTERAEIFLDMPLFKKPKKLADLDRISLTLKLIPKSRVNIFHLFGEGIGINEEMILRLNFKLIECEINGKLYQTTYQHLLQKAIRSPYQNHKVDRQRILKLEDFHIPESEEILSEPLTLFEQAP
jgi:hypothetical protein